VSGSNRGRSKILVEIVKHLLELAVVIIVGGAIAAVYKAHESARAARAKEKDELLLKAAMRARIHEDYLKRLGMLYRSVKSSRRRLCAAGLTQLHATHLSADHCNALSAEMGNINDAQLELEGMKIESARLPAFMDLAGLTGQLYSMEDYLRDLLAEYERWMPQLLEGTQIAFSELPRLLKFTGPTRQAMPGRRFLESFWRPYEEIVDKISESIGRAST
jgi:hypothetical protein